MEVPVKGGGGDGRNVQLRSGRAMGAATQDSLSASQREKGPAGWPPDHHQITNYSGHTHH